MVSDLQSIRSSMAFLFYHDSKCASRSSTSKICSNPTSCFTLCLTAKIRMPSPLASMASLGAAKCCQHELSPAVHPLSRQNKVKSSHSLSEFESRLCPLLADDPHVTVNLSSHA